MKKIISAILVLCLVAALWGCGKVADDLSVYTHTVTGLEDGEAVTRCLLLNDEISVKFYFAVETAPESVTCDGTEIPVVAEPDGRFSVTVRDIPVAELDRQIVFDFGSIHVDTSILAYINELMNSDKDEAFKEMTEVLLEKYCAARAGK